MRFLADDELLLDKVVVHAEQKQIPVSTLNGYVRQHPNAKWFTLFKVPLGVYCLSGTDSTSRINRFFQRLGEPPVVYDSIQAERASLDMQAAVRNLGYLNSTVSIDAREKKQRLKLLEMNYTQIWRKKYESIDM